MLELKHISKQFKERFILKDVSITFPDCGLIGIQGVSGCGKSTLLYILGMLDKDYTGEIYWNDEIITNQRQFIQKHISFMMQNKDYISSLTIKENIQLACQVSHQDYTSSQFKKISIQLGIQDLLNKYPYQLSGGQLKRVSLAKALLKQSSIILADEPTGALHYEQTHEVMALLKKYSQEVLIIVVSHDPQLLKKYCDSVLTLKNEQLLGEMIQTKKENFFPKTRFQTLLIYPLRQLLYQKNKLIFLCLFQWIIIVAFFAMMTGMNGILEAIQAGEIHSVNAHIMTVENKNGQSFEHMIEDEKIQYCSYVYHLEQLEVRSFNQILSTLVSFLPKETSHIQLSQGRLPQQTYEILITESLYQKLSHNQTLNFVFQDQQYSMNIVGIVKQELFQNDEIYCLQSFQNHVNELKDEFTLCVEAKVNQGRKLYQNLSQKYIPYSEVFERSDSYQSLLSLARMVAYVFIGVSGIISLILIRIVLSILYYERKHDVAYLLSLGITHTRFRCLSLLESLFLGIVIAGGGCILSAIFYEYINHVFHIEKLLLFSFVLKPLWQSDFDLYILIILMYMMMCIIGTLKPLKTVLKTNVVDILREE